MHAKPESLEQLLESYSGSQEPSFKVSNYFPIYADLFSHLRGTTCTFVETGVLHGGSLFMWRRWLGGQARIVGIDMNPAARKWAEFGFEIHIGDQGDPEFWREVLPRIGVFDALLDDGGHQSFQQITTLSEALRFASHRCIVAIEDTCANFMKEFSRHREYSFLQYAKDATDNLLAKTAHLFPGQFPPLDNPGSIDLFRNVYSIEFFAGIVAFKLDPALVGRPELVWNRKPKRDATDFRYAGKESATVEWPSPFTRKTVVVRGGKS